LDTVSTLLGVFASWAPVLTEPTFANLAVLLRGAVVASGPRTVTGCLAAAWPWVTKHWSAYENVARRARMPMLVMARGLFLLVLALLPGNAVIELVVDETLVRRYGPWVVGVGMHRDAVRSSQRRVEVSPGHKWVTLGVVMRLSFLRCPVAFPLLSVAYSTRKHARRNHAKRLYRTHRTVCELALLMVRWVVRWAPGRQFRLIGDGSYGTHELANALCPTSLYAALRRASLVSRFPLDGATYAAPSPRSGRGRPRVKGAKLPSPRQVAADPSTVWTRVRIAWYGGTCREVLLCSGAGLWYRPGCGVTPVRWVLVRQLEGKRGDEVFFTTDLTMAPEAIVETFVRRWSLETTFEETRAHLGLEGLRNRSANAVRRSVPLLLALYSLIVVWFARHVRDPGAWVRSRPWYPKEHVTFSDMLAAARQDILAERISSHPVTGTVESEIGGPATSEPPVTHSALRLTA